MSYGERVDASLDWTEYNYFTDKNVDIVKIDCTSNSYFCLDSDGRLWAIENVSRPPKRQRQYRYTIATETIIDFACGDYVRNRDNGIKTPMILALDDKGVMYESTNFETQKIESPDDNYKFIKIKACAQRGLYAISNKPRYYTCDETKHFMWTPRYFPTCDGGGDIGGWGNRKILNVIKDYECIDVAFGNKDSIFIFKQKIQCGMKKLSCKEDPWEPINIDWVGDRLDHYEVNDENQFTIRLKN